MTYKSQLARVVALAALMSFASAWLAGSAFAAGPQPAARIVSPRADQVVGNGRVLVVVRSRAKLSGLRMFVNGRNVKRYFQRSGGAYRATLGLGRGLQPGVDQLVVSGAAFARVRFIVARPGKLLARTQLRIGGNETPVRVVVKTAPGSTLQVLVNGHRDEGAFHPQGGVYVGRLGANDSLRPGRNRIVVLSYRTSSSGRSASYQQKTLTFSLKPGQLRAGAGEDRTVNAGNFIQLDASATAIPRPRHLSYRWQIVGRPAGPRATLTNPASRSPGFLATAPGQYLVRARVTAGNGRSSVDTVTVTVREDVPPIGMQLDTVADDRGTIQKGGVPVANTTEPCDPAAQGGCNNRASYAVFNRQTLGPAVESGNVSAPDGMKKLLDLANKYNAAPTYLMVVNLMPSAAGSRADGQKLLEALGVARMSDADRTSLFTRTVPVSIIGVPGSPANPVQTRRDSAHSFGSTIVPKVQPGGLL